MADVQNNFTSTNGGNFADRKIVNRPIPNPVDAMLSSTKNQGQTAIRSTGNFNSKAINQ